MYCFQISKACPCFIASSLFPLVRKEEEEEEEEEEKDKSCSVFKSTKHIHVLSLLLSFHW